MPNEASARAEIVRAHNVSLETRAGWLFRGVTVEIHEHTVVAIVGPAGANRSGLVQVLGASVEPTEGALSFFGQQPGHDEQDVRRHIGVVALPDNVKADLATPIHQCVSEHLTLSGVPQASDVFDAAADVVGFRPGRATVVADLPASQRRLLALALSLTSPKKLIVCYDVEEGLSVGDSARIWAGLRAAAGTGPAVVAGTGHAPRWVDQVITLDTATLR